MLMQRKQDTLTKTNFFATPLEVSQHGVLKNNYSENRKINFLRYLRLNEISDHPVTEQ